jgi:hypothetical protein
LEKDCVGKICDWNFLEGSRQKRLHKPIRRFAVLYREIRRISSDRWRGGLFCKDRDTVWIFKDAFQFFIFFISSVQAYVSMSVLASFYFSYLHMLVRCFGILKYFST